MSKKRLIICLSIVIIVLALITALIMVLKANKNNLETDWANAYFNYIYKDVRERTETKEDSNGNKVTINPDYYKNTSDVKIKFIEVKEDTDPIMAVIYKKDGKQKISMYIKKEENDVSVGRLPYTDYRDIEGEGFENMNFSLEYLYNLEENIYKWYVKQTFEDNSASYTPIDSYYGDKDAEYLINSQKMYGFNKDEMKTGQTDENGNPIITKFDETLIKIDEETNSFIEIGKIHNIKKNDLKKYIKAAEKAYKDINEIVSDKMKTTVEEKKKSIEETKEKIKKAEEENAKKEEKIKTEENTSKVAEKQTNKELKVGNYTLKYGKYVGDDYAEGTENGPSGQATYTIKEDGTYSFAPTNGEVLSGKYRVVNLSSLGSYYNGMYGLEFSNGGKVGVPANDTLQALAGAGNQFKYQGK